MSSDGLNFIMYFRLIYLQGNRYSMFLLVPQEKAGLNTLLRDLPYMSLPQITPFMENTNVRLFMPKFSIDYSESMVGALRSVSYSEIYFTI